VRRELAEIQLRGGLVDVRSTHTHCYIDVLTLVALLTDDVSMVHGLLQGPAVELSGGLSASPTKISWQGWQAMEPSPHPLIARFAAPYSTHRARLGECTRTMWICMLVIRSTRYLSRVYRSYCQEELPSTHLEPSTWQSIWLFLRVTS
jgi:hypothetical protein